MGGTSDLYRLDEHDLSGKRVFLRVDFNVPLKEGRVADDSRLRAHLPAIRQVLEKGGSVVLASHLGRPKGKPDPAYSLKPVVEALAPLVGKEILFAGDCVGAEAEKLAAALKPGDVLLLENLRFHAEEETNDAAFAKKLVSLADIYVNDAFASSHRAHASVDAAPKAAAKKAAGPLLCAEVEYLQRVLAVPQRPLVAVIGGAKISTKIEVLRALAAKVDALLVGGAMANTFLAALGFSMGASLAEPDLEGTALEVLEAALERKVHVGLPHDVVCSSKGHLGGVYRQTLGIRSITSELSALDIGPITRSLFAQVIAGAGTVLWNGPMGLFEEPAFAAGTLAVGRAVATCRGLTVAGGGDTLAALNQLGLSDAIDHLSTGGGAFLEWIEGKKLPGVEALRRG